MNRAAARAFRLIEEVDLEVDLETLEKLLQELSGRWQPNRDGESLLHAAVARGPKVVDLLLRYESPVEGGRQHGATPLHLACEMHEHETVALLLAHGADPNRLNAATQGASCLHLLLDRPIKSLEAVASSMRRLHAAGAGPDLGNTATGDTPLIVLCSTTGWKSRLPLVELLIELGADVDRRNSLGYSPLMAAELAGQRRLTSCLRRHGAREEGIWTARLHAALRGSRNLAVALWTRGRSDAKLALRAVSRGADVNAPDFEGDVPLATALLHGDDALVEALIGAGAKIDFGYGDCRTPLVAAAEAGRIEWVRRFLDQGADPERTTAYGNAWECAEDPEIRDLLRSQS